MEFVPMVWGYNSAATCQSGQIQPSGSSCGYTTDGVDATNHGVDNSTGQNTGLTACTIAANIPASSKYVLGFNEPDFAHQSDLTPKQAAKQWSDVENIAKYSGCSGSTWGTARSTPLKIVSPAVNFCDATCTTDNKGCCTMVNDAHVSGQMNASGTREQAFRWLEHFYDECQATYTIPYASSTSCTGTWSNGLCTYNGAAGHTCEIDYQAMHSYSWYGIWSVNPLKVHGGLMAPSKAHCTNATQDVDEDGTDCGGEDCQACDPNVRKIFQKQAWLTEFAPTTDDCNLTGGLSACLAAQVSQAQTYIGQWVAAGGNPGTGNIDLEDDPFIFRYAWFMPKINTITSLNNDTLLQVVTNTDPTPWTAVGTAYLNASFTSGIGVGGGADAGTTDASSTDSGGGGGGTLTKYSQTGWSTNSGTTASNNLSTLYKAFDGSVGTRWTSGHAQQSQAGYVEIDMGVSQAFAQVTIDSQTSSDWIRNYNIQVSTDNSTWTQVYPSSGNAAGSSGVTTATFTATTARYVKINQAITSGVSNYWSPYEVNIWH
jgi:hypothetical protein